MRQCVRHKTSTAKPPEKQSRPNALKRRCKEIVVISACFWEKVQPSCPSSHANSASTRSVEEDARSLAAVSMLVGACWRLRGNCLPVGGSHAGDGFNQQLLLCKHGSPKTTLHGGYRCCCSASFVVWMCSCASSGAAGQDGGRDGVGLGVFALLLLCGMEMCCAKPTSWATQDIQTIGCTTGCITNHWQLLLFAYCRGV